MTYLSILLAAKSLPLHCVVESFPSLQASVSIENRTSWKRRSNIEIDSYVIIPSATPFSDIVKTAIQSLGYTPDIANTAKGNYTIMNFYVLISFLNNIFLNNFIY